MIDLHCHPLPGIDDGPASIAEALALLRSSARAGVRTAVATPHVSWRYPNDAARIRELTAELSARLRHEGIGIDLVPGAEIAATRVPDLASDQLLDLRLGDGPWLLLEPALTPRATGFDQIAFGLMRRGHRIVIAHPERCPGFQRDHAMLAALVSSGALTSITAGSLGGRFGRRVRRFAIDLVDRHLVHNVSSDAHDDLRRPPGIAAEIESAGLADLREWLTELVPAAILSGEPIPPRPTLHGRLPPRGRLLPRLRAR